MSTMPELLAQDLDLLRSEPGNLKHLDQTRLDRGLELLVEPQTSGQNASP